MFRSAMVDIDNSPGEDTPTPPPSASQAFFSFWFLLRKYVRVCYLRGHIIIRTKISCVKIGECVFFRSNRGFSLLLPISQAPPEYTAVPHTYYSSTRRVELLGVFADNSVWVMLLVVGFLHKTCPNPRKKYLLWGKKVAQMPLLT